MRRTSLVDLISLQKSFEENHGYKKRLIDYFAQPRIHLGASHETFMAKCLENLVKRTPFDQLPQLGFAPADMSIFKKRFSLASTDNFAYSVLMNDNPSIPDLERFSYLLPGWSVLFPLKAYLIFHPEKAREYRGLLPFGSEVVKFFNATIGTAKPTPTFQDHIALRDYTNALSDHLGISTVMLNNEMYLEGSRMK